jgi:hypothetical protein
MLDKFQSFLINENEIFLEDEDNQSQEEDLEAKESSDSSQPRYHSSPRTKHSKEMIFDRSSCVIQTTADSSLLILRANKSIYSAFGYTPQ